MDGTGTTRVIIVEDQELPAQYVAMILAPREDFTVVRIIKSAEMAYFYCAQGNIDLVIMDIFTGLGSDGLAASARIKAAFPQIKIVAVTSMPEVSYLKRAREAGVDSFWYKEVAGEPLLDVLTRTVAGESIYPDSTPEVMIGKASSGVFTERELDVLRELVRGVTNHEIAAKLFLSSTTVKDHISNMLAKTGLHSRTELAVRARELGLIIPECDA